VNRREFVGSAIAAALVARFGKLLPAPVVEEEWEIKTPPAAYISPLTLAYSSCETMDLTMRYAIKDREFTWVFHDLPADTLVFPYLQGLEIVLELPDGTLMKPSSSSTRLV
jgi:hypothetical protein